MSELAGEPFVMVPREIAPGLYDIVTGLAARAGISFNVAQEAIQMQTVVSLVSSGLGAAIVPGSIANLGRRGVVYRELADSHPRSICGSPGRAAALGAAARDFLALRAASAALGLRCSSTPTSTRSRSRSARSPCAGTGSCTSLGFAAGWWLGMRRIKQGIAPVTRQQFDDLLFLVVLGVILGGRLGYVLFYKPGYYLAHPLEIFSIWQGGMSFHGGLLGVMLAMTFAARQARHRLAAADGLRRAARARRASPPGAWATSSTASCRGRVTDVPWGMVFRGAGDAPRHPSQLYQFALEGLVLFVLLWWFSSKPRPRGQVSALFLIGYGSLRFIAEFVREPDAFLGLLALGMTMGQWLCLR